jgi:hypothetical protein
LLELIRRLVFAVLIISNRFVNDDYGFEWEAVENYVNQHPCSTSTRLRLNASQFSVINVEFLGGITS